MTNITQIKGREKEIKIETLNFKLYNNHKTTGE